MTYAIDGVFIFLAYLLCGYALSSIASLTTLVRSSGRHTHEQIRRILARNRPLYRILACTSIAIGFTFISKVGSLKEVTLFGVRSDLILALLLLVDMYLFLWSTSRLEKIINAIDVLDRTIDIKSSAALGEMDGRFTLYLRNFESERMGQKSSILQPKAPVDNTSAYIRRLVTWLSQKTLVLEAANLEFPNRPTPTTDSCGMISISLYESDGWRDEVAIFMRTAEAIVMHIDAHSESLKAELVLCLRHKEKARILVERKQWDGWAFHEIGSLVGLNIAVYNYKLEPRWPIDPTIGVDPISGVSRDLHEFVLG